MNKKEIFSIPNILSIIRLVLIPIFAWVYLTAGSNGEYYFAAIIVVISGITDFLDGAIARKFNMITELGKFLDPLADKLTQGTLFLCLAIRHPLMWLLVALWAMKDGFMGIMGLVLLKKKNTKLQGANWYGKVCTAIIYVAVILILFFPGFFGTGEIQTAVLILVCAGALALSGVLYAMVLIKMWIHSDSVKKKKNEKDAAEKA